MFDLGFLCWSSYVRLLPYVTMQRNLENRRHINLAYSRTVAEVDCVCIRDCDSASYITFSLHAFHFLFGYVLPNGKCTLAHVLGLSGGTVMITGYATLFPFFCVFHLICFLFFVRLCTHSRLYMRTNILIAAEYTYVYIYNCYLVAHIVLQSSYDFIFLSLGE